MSLTPERANKLAHDCTQRIVESKAVLLRDAETGALVLLVPMWNIRDAIRDMLRELEE